MLNSSTSNEHDETVPTKKHQNKPLTRKIRDKILDLAKGFKKVFDSVVKVAVNRSTISPKVFSKGNSTKYKNSNVTLYQFNTTVIKEEYCSMCTCPNCLRKRA